MPVFTCPPRAPATTVAQLIGIAYQVQDYQLIAGEDWIRSQLFAVNARMRIDAPTDPSASGDFYGRMSLMLRALLAERFKLLVRNESRMLPTYSLVVASRDKTLGPKLTSSLVNCKPGGDAAKGQEAQCGLHVFPNRLLGVSVPINALGNVLSGRVSRPVLDETGLSGVFDYELTWASDDVLPNPSVPTGPSLFTALQEQLGLRLTPVQAPVDVLVIARIERPTPD